MPSKNKTFIALTVKLLLFVVCAHAQQPADSARQKSISFSPLIYVAPPVKTTFAPARLPGNFYAKQLPFFCAKELKVQKATGIPIKFRVGSVAYCDKLEGKQH